MQCKSYPSSCTEQLTTDAMGKSSLSPTPLKMCARYSFNGDNDKTTRDVFGASDTTQEESQGRKTRPRARRDRSGRGAAGTDSAANTADQGREGFASCGDPERGSVALWLLASRVVIALSLCLSVARLET